MTLKEASRRFQVSMEQLTCYEQNELIICEAFVDGIPDYTECELRKIGIIHSLLKAGMDISVLQRYLQLLRKKTESKEEQIKILRKQRCILLEEIHCKQQSLDELDYMINEIKKENRRI